MRIVYCLPELSHPGGIGRVTTIKANWFAEHGHDVFVVSSSQCGEPDYFVLHPSVRHIDFNIGFQAGMDNSNVVKKLFNKRGKMQKYKVLLKDFLYSVKADIVVSTFCNDSDFLYKLKDGSKKVLEFHFSHDGYKSVIKYGHLSFVQRLVQIYKIKKQEFIAKKYDAFVILTKEDAAAWIGYDNIHVIPNMLTFESQKVSDCMSKRVIAVGRLDYQKKFERLIDIWGKVMDKCSDWKLDIYGNGPDKDMLNGMIASKKLGGKVEIHAPTPNIKNEYLQSSILAMTSSYEGWGLVLTEAMNCGVPCIAYACKCGPKDIIDDGENGYIVDEGNIDCFCDKLLSLIVDDDKRVEMGHRSKDKSAFYNVDNIMELWQTLFSKLLKG